MAGLRTGIAAKDDTSCIINNFRPPMPLNDRRVGLFTGESTLAAIREEPNDEVNKNDLAIEGIETKLIIAFHWITPVLPLLVTELKQMMREIKKELIAVKSVVAKDLPNGE